MEGSRREPSGRTTTLVNWFNEARLAIGGLFVCLQFAQHWHKHMLASQCIIALIDLAGLPSHTIYSWHKLAQRGTKP